MDLRLKTWNSLNINNGSPFDAWFPMGSKVNLSANAVTVNRVGDFPYLSTTVLTPGTLTIGVKIAAGQNINTNREVLKKYFDITDAQRHNLIAEDGSGGTQWYVTGFPIRVVPADNDEIAYIITFAIEYPYWRLVTAASDTWLITASAQTHAVTNSGNKKVPPSFTITPTTAASDGLKYRRWVAMYNNLDVSYTDALDVTNGGLNTSTLISGGKMQSDGDDLRVWLDGVEVDRWLNGINTSTTKVWVNLQFAPRKQATINAAFTTAATTMTFARTATNKTFLESLKRVTNRILLVDSEALLFTASNVDTFNYQITSISRAQKGTTAVNHVSGSTVRHIEHDCWILYGDSTLSAPDVDDNYKPMWALTSTNFVRSYFSTTGFYDKDVNRPGSWYPQVLSTRTGLSYNYTGNQNTFIDPAAHMGMALIGSDDFRTQNEVGAVAWTISHPAEILQVQYSGRKYATTNNSGSWPVIAGLQYLQTGVVWITKRTDAAPLLASVWETFGTYTDVLPSAVKTLRFALDGTLDSLASAKAMLQISAVLLSLISNQVPTISVGSEQAAYELNFVLDNDTTGESIRCNTPIGLNQTLTIDCENKSVSLSDGGRAVIELSSDRDNWLDLSAGSNTLQFTDAGTAGVTLVTNHRDRTL